MKQYYFCAVNGVVCCGSVRCGTSTMSAYTRSFTSPLEKEVGTITALPLRPLTKKDILARYCELKGNQSAKGTDKSNLPYNNHDRTERNLAKIICEEIEVLYKKFGIKTITPQNICVKVLQVKKEYYKAAKSPQSRARYVINDSVSFKAKKQPKTTLKEDLEWYQRKIEGGPGVLGSIDLEACRREKKRQERTPKMKGKKAVTDHDCIDTSIEEDEVDIASIEDEVEMPETLESAKVPITP